LLLHRGNNARRITAEQLFSRCAAHVRPTAGDITAVMRRVAAMDSELAAVMNRLLVNLHSGIVQVTELCERRAQKAGAVRLSQLLDGGSRCLPWITVDQGDELEPDAFKGRPCRRVVEYDAGR
jgi:hypothetical protein